MLTYVIDDIFFGVIIVRVRWIDRTNYIDLIVLGHRVVLVHVDYMIRVVYSKSVTKKRKNKFISKNGQRYNFNLIIQNAKNYFMKLFVIIMSNFVETYM